MSPDYLEAVKMEELQPHHDLLIEAYAIAGGLTMKQPTVAHLQVLIEARQHDLDTCQRLMQEIREAIGT